MTNPTFAEQTQLGSERTYTNQVGFGRSGIFVLFGLLSVAAALIACCFHRVSTQGVYEIW